MQCHEGATIATGHYYTVSRIPTDSVQYDIDENSNWIELNDTYIRRTSFNPMWNRSVMIVILQRTESGSNFKIKYYINSKEHAHVHLGVHV